MTKDVTASLNSGYELLHFKSIPKSEEHVKTFEVSYPLVAKLSGKQRVFLDFVLQQMSNENIIKNDKWLKKNFSIYNKGINQASVSDSTINNYLLKLCKVELAFRISKGRGTYQINPYFFFKGTLLNREKLIRKNLEFINKEPINRHRYMSLKNLALTGKK